MFLGIRSEQKGNGLQGISHFIEEANAWLAEHGPGIASNIFLALLTLVIGRWVAGLMRRFLRRVLESRKVDATLSSFLQVAEASGPSSPAMTSQSTASQPLSSANLTTSEQTKQ